MRLRTYLFLAFGVGILVFSLPASASAATYYVATTGLNSRSCATATDINTPKLTISSGLTCLVAGDTLEIRAGTYVEYVVIQNLNGTPASPITIRNNPGETVTLRPPAGLSDAVSVFNNASYVVFDGLTVDGANVLNHALTIDGLDAANPTHHITLKNSGVKNAPQSGMNIVRGAHTNTISNNKISNNGFNPPRQSAPRTRNLY